MTTVCTAAPSLRCIEERNAIALRNEKLVGWVLGYFFHRLAHTSAAEDLLQAGRLGLLRAAELYSPEKGAFATFAVFWIRREMRAELRRHCGPITRPAEPKCAMPEVRSLESRRRDEVALDVADPSAIDPADACESSELAEAVEDALARLPDLHAGVLALREGGATLDAVAAELGIGRSVVTRIEGEAREMLASDGRLRELAG